MKKLLILVAFSTILFSCSTTQPVAEVVAAPTIYVVDDYYILMSDAYHLRPGMNYDEVESVLKQDPYEIHQNINDNLYTPLSLAMFSDKHNIHFTYIGTGCIFSDNEKQFTEDRRQFQRDRH